MRSSSGGGDSYLHFLLGRVCICSKKSLTSAATIKHSRRMPQDYSNDSMRLPSILFACAFGLRSRHIGSRPIRMRAKPS